MSSVISNGFHKLAPKTLHAVSMVHVGALWVAKVKGEIYKNTSACNVNFI